MVSNPLKTSELLKFPDQEFMKAYLNVIEERFPTPAEMLRYANAKKNRPRISMDETLSIKARLEPYRIVESIDLRTFKVRIMVDAEEMVWLAFAKTKRQAQRLVIKAARETGAETYKIIN